MATYKKNTFANYVGQTFTLIMGVVVFPLYLKYMGSAAFGLIGLFLVLQAWLRLLDIGLSPTLARYVARARAKKENFFELKQLLRSLEVIFFSVSILIILFVVSVSRWVTYHWLSIGNLDGQSVIHCLWLMGLIIGLSWFADLYQGGIRGMERLVLLNGFNIAIATLRYLGALAFLHWVSSQVVSFFEYQVGISALELILMMAAFYKQLPATMSVGFKLNWPVLKQVLPFAGSIAYSALIWALLTQLDKLLLSKTLILSHYGYFALVTIISGGILQLVMPVGQVLMPRLTYLVSENRISDMLQLYQNAMQAIAVFVIPLVGIIALFGKQLIYIWTGDLTAANWAAPILTWYALGNGLLAISIFQYYLQFAYGKLRLHILYNTFSALISIPLILFAAFHYGALGVALVWFCTRLLGCVVWMPFIHSRYMPKLAQLHLLKELVTIFITVTVVLLIISRLGIEFTKMSRVEIAVILFGLSLVTFLISCLVSKVCRQTVLNFFKKGYVSL